MGDILKKLTELLENGGNYEQARSTGIIISANYFDAIDAKESEAGSRDRSDKKGDSEDLPPNENKSVE